MSLRELFLIVVYVVYGGTFIVMAVSLWVFSERTAKLGIAQKLRVLAFFAIAHGISDMIDAVLRFPRLQIDPTGALVAVRLSLLVVSFLFLLWFGIGILITDEGLYRTVIGLGTLAVVGAMAGLVALYAQGVTEESVISVNRAARLVLGFPATMIASVGFFQLSRKCHSLRMEGCAKDSILAAASIAAYGVLAGLVPAGFRNPVLFLGLPIQFYRMIAAIALTAASISLLRRFEVKK